MAKNTMQIRIDMRRWANDLREARDACDKLLQLCHEEPADKGEPDPQPKTAGRPVRVGDEVRYEIGDIRGWVIGRGTSPGRADVLWADQKRPLDQSLCFIRHPDGVHVSGLTDCRPRLTSERPPSHDDADQGHDVLAYSRYSGEWESVRWGSVRTSPAYYPKWMHTPLFWEES